MAKGQVKQEFESATKDGRIQKFIDALRGGLNRDTAISFAGLKRQTVYDWLKKLDDFHTKVIDAEEYRFAIVENEKNKLIKAGNRNAIEKELKSKKRAIYGDKAELDQTTTHIGEIVVKLPGEDIEEDEQDEEGEEKSKKKKKK